MDRNFHLFRIIHDRNHPDRNFSPYLTAMKVKPKCDKTNKMTCAPSEDSDQSEHPPSSGQSSLCALCEAKDSKDWCLLCAQTFFMQTAKTDQTWWMDAQSDQSLCWTCIILLVLSYFSSCINFSIFVAGTWWTSTRSKFTSCCSRGYKAQKLQSISKVSWVFFQTMSMIVSFLLLAWKFVHYTVINYKWTLISFSVSSQCAHGKSFIVRKPEVHSKILIVKNFLKM